MIKRTFSARMEMRVWSVILLTIDAYALFFKIVF